MNNLILVRHGQSLWNKERRFTGFVDIELTEEGKSEAKRAGQLIKELNIKFDVCFTSQLKRAINTLNIILKVLDNPKVKINKAWELNERHYGGLTGLNKDDTIKKYGNNCLIIDFGTATTFDVIKKNKYEGGVIAPGIDISHDALVKYASKLKKISIIRTKSLVGNNTKDSMQSGFYWGYISLINGVIEKIIKQQRFKPTIILTGGLANIFKKEISQKTEYEPNLTLNGLYLIGKIKYG